jgi:glyoxylase-like metal-dependent hydrolase (beta-lactamase superfamily II)|nr:MBL fold metallo-hydrolase [uncultured Pedobacter sp.]
MKRRSFLASSGITLGAIALGGYSGLASVLMQEPYKIKMLTDNLGVFTEQGGTIAFLIPDKGANNGLIVVDSQFVNPAQHLVAELKKKSDSPFELLINTHHHADHTSGNIVFKGLVKHVFAHENSLANQTKVAETAKANGKEIVEQYYPDTVFKSDYTYKTGKDTIKAYYFGAGHTNGDAMIHFENQNAVHMGDLVFNRRFPYIDKTAGADIHSWIKVLDKAIATFGARTNYIFGHAYNPDEIVGTVEDVKAYQNYLEKLLAFVDSEIKSGKSKEEILKATAIPGATEWKGDGIQRSLDAAYQELYKG